MSKKISELTSASSLGSNDLFAIVQGGTTKKITADKFANAGVIKLGNTLSVVDGTAPTLTNNSFYYINGLSVNGVTDDAFAFSIIFFWASGGDYYIDLINKYTKIEVPQTIGKRYRYNNGTWSLTDTVSTTTSVTSSSTNAQIPTAKAVYDIVPQITYSTTDLTPAVSQLDEGSFYFVYE